MGQRCSNRSLRLESTQVEQAPSTPRTPPIRWPPKSPSPARGRVERPIRSPRTRLVLSDRLLAVSPCSASTFAASTNASVVRLLSRCTPSIDHRGACLPSACSPTALARTTGSMDGHSERMCSSRAPNCAALLAMPRCPPVEPTLRITSVPVRIVPSKCGVLRMAGGSNPGEESGKPASWREDDRITGGAKATTAGRLPPMLASMISTASTIPGRARCISLAAASASTSAPYT